MRAVLIAGPTASGKSRLALDLACEIGGVIVNADSMQVYRELRALTARPSREDEAAIPHRLYGHVSAAGHYSVGRWLGEAIGAMGAAWKEGLTPIVVGGTGLYFRALEQGLAPVPDIPASIRARWRAALAKEGAEALHRRLARLAPAEAARLRPSDGQRIGRALEVLDATGETLAAYQKHAIHASPLRGVDVARHLLMPDRAELHERARRRLQAMVEQGALEEVRALVELRLEPTSPVLKAIGVKPLARHIGGEIELEEALAEAQRQTRQYIKRQLTWFRNQMADWPIVR